MIPPLLSNELDRSRFDMDPDKFEPAATKAVIRRIVVDDLHRGLVLPSNSKAKRPLFEGHIVKMGSEIPDGYEDLSVGQHVWFSYQVGADDSAFFDFEGQHYAVIPIEAIQMFEAE